LKLKEKYKKSSGLLGTPFALHRKERDEELTDFKMKEWASQYKGVCYEKNHD
jgi:hypothetical protein